MIRKFLCLLLAVVLTALLLCGCKNTYSPIEEFTYTKPEKMIFKTEFSQYPSDVKEIRIFYINTSDETVFMGSGYEYLLMFTDGEWQYVNGKRDPFFPLLSLRLDPGKEQISILNVDQLYYTPLEPGLYMAYTLNYYSEPFEIVE